MLGPEQPDSAVALREALVEGLLLLPFLDQLQNRIDLVRLIQEDCPGFPDVPEKRERRLHTLEIVRACLALPRALPVLRKAVHLMAPEQAGTIRVDALIGSMALEPPAPAASTLRTGAMRHGRHLDPRLYELLTAQLDDAQHPYQFFEGHVPALSKIYVQQRGEATDTIGGAQPDGGVVLTVPQMLLKHPHALVVAGPGMGKSTLVWRIQRDQAAWWLEQTRSDRVEPSALGRVVPVAIPASLLVEHSLGEAFDEATRRLGCRQGLHELLGEPPAPGATWLVMVDGVDEVLNSRERSVVLNRLAARIDRADPAMRFLITTRPLPYGYLTDIRAQGVVEFGLKGFDRAELVTFARKWFAARDHGADIDRLTKRFVDEVTSAGLSALTEIPLLATIAALAFENEPERPLPNSRAQLYEWFVMHLRYGRRSSVEQASRAQAELERSTPPWQRAWQWVEDNVVELLEHLADGHLNRDPTPATQRAESWVMRHCTEKSLTQVPGWRNRIRNVLTGTSLLAEYGTDNISFTHHSFAEFLAAGPRAAHFDTRAWLTDVLSPHRRGLAIFVLARRHEPADDLVQTLLDGLGEHVVAAGDILAEGIEVADPLYRRVVAALVQQLTNEDITAPEALRVLVALSRNPEVAVALTELIADGRNRSWVRATLADGLDEMDRGDRLGTLARDPTVAPDARWWAAQRAGGAVADRPDQAGPASDRTVVGPATVLSRHIFHRDLNDVGSHPRSRLRIAMNLAAWGDAAGTAALRRCVTDPTLNFEEQLRAARALLDCDDGAHGYLRQVAASTAHPDEVRAAAALALTERVDSGQAAPSDHSSVDHPAELRRALVAALLAIPFMNNLADRRMLVSLMRRGVSGLPDAIEHTTAESHVTEIVRASLGRPGGLRALLGTLLIMAPDSAGTARARLVIESATLPSLLPEDELERVRGLLDLAGATREPAWWRTLLDGHAPGNTHPVHAFDELASRSPGADGAPLALTLVARIADALDGPIAVELSAWAERIAERLDVRTSGVDSAGAAAQADPGAVHGHYLDAQSPMTRIDIDDYGDAVEAGRMGHATGPRGHRADQLPQVWGDVPPRNPNFTGREELLARLHDALRTRRKSAILPQALHGMGGVGKSQVAIEYVHRHATDYDLVWWIPAERPAQILTSLTMLAQQLDLNVSPQANTAVPAVLEALSTGRLPHEKWLLVFDNAEDLGDVRPYFPTGGRGTILVTSRNPEWAAIALAMEVDVFARHESTLYLIRRTPELSETDADRLAEALGDLPLAIEQAAAWLAATGMAVNEYLSLLNEKRIELLEVSATPDYELSVAAAWTVSLERLRATDPAALQLLRVCSFYAPEPIPRDILVGSPNAPITPELDEALASPIRLARAIRVIQRYALARVDHRHDTLQVHRLVQAVLIGHLEHTERETMRRGAHTLLANSDPRNPGQPSQWNRYQSLLPHLMASRAVESDDVRVQELVLHMVEFLYHWGDHEGCERLAADAYHHQRMSLGESHPRTLRLARWLAYIHWVLGRYQQASELHTQTLALCQEHFGEEDDSTLEATTFMAAVLRANGDFSAASEMDRRAVAIAHRAFGPDDPITLTAAGSLAVSLRLTGEFRQAAQLDEETYRRSVQVLGADDNRTLSRLNGLAIDIRECGDYQAALVRQDEVYQRHLAVFGPDAPATLCTARDLAVARRKAGDYQGAQELSELTFASLSRRYGDDYPDTLAAATALAIDLRLAGELDQARDLAEVTLSRYGRIFGTSHPHTLSARVNLAAVQRMRGDAEGAYRADSETYDALVGTLGPDHAVTLTCATNLATDLFVLDDFGSAFERDTDTLQRSGRVLGLDHPSTLARGLNLSADLRAIGREDTADEVMADMVTRYRRALGDNHPELITVLRGLRANGDIDPLPI